MLPLSKSPVSLVTVWVTESLFVQVTFVPALAVSVAGEKAKPEMLTLRVYVPWAPVVVAVFCPEVQPENTKIVNKAKQINLLMKPPFNDDCKFKIECIS